MLRSAFDYSLITQAGLTHKEFAQAIGVTRESISKWSTGLRVPSRANFDKLRAAMPHLRRLARERPWKMTEEQRKEHVRQAFKILS